MAEVMTSVVSEGVELAVEALGEGEPISVLAHGLTGSRDDLSLFAPFLPGTKILFDFRGHGLSGRPGPGSYSLEHLSGDVDNVAKAFGASCLLGTSLGGLATLRLLTRDPDRFDKLVFVFPARLQGSMTAHAKLMRLADFLDRYPLERVADLLAEEEDRSGAFEVFPAARELRRDAILRMNRDGLPHAIREALDERPIGAEELRDVLAPALVIGQRGDPVHDAEVAEELAAALTNAELHLYDSPAALVRDIPALVQRVAAFLEA